MTPQQKFEARRIHQLATEARRTLGSNFDRGTTARPTVAQLNFTLDALREIENKAAHILASDLPDFK